MTQSILTGRNPKIETVEQSGRKNWIASQLQQNGYLHFGFEGATISEKNVSAFLDRLAFSGTLLRRSINEVCQDFQELSGDFFEYKLKFLQHLSRQHINIPWFLVVYTYNYPSNTVAPIYVLKLNEKSTPVIGEFTENSALEDFAQWLQQRRSMMMTSSFQEKTHLAPFDEQLRRMNMPWPGNVDGILHSQKSEGWALIEFQYTKANSVEKHCNNVYFAPKSGRKGDEQRWIASKMIADSLKLPLIIIVWNDDPQQGLKLKKVDRVNPLSSPNPGLQYSFKKYYPHHKLDCFFHDLSSLV